MVLLPDRARRPRHLPVALAHLELRRQLDLAHGGPDVLARVHRGDDGVVHVQRRVAHALDLGANRRAPNNRPEVPDAQQLRVEAEQQLERRHVLERVAVAVAADCYEVREVPEQRAEDVAGEQDPVLRQPYHERIARFGAVAGDQLELRPAELEVEALAEEDVGFRLRLFGRRRSARALHAAERLREREGRAPLAKRREPRVVGLMLGVVRLGDHERAGLLEQVDAAHVIDVPLGEHDVLHSARVDRIEIGLMDGRFEAHAGVDHHAAGGRHHQKRVRVALGQVDEIVDGLVAHGGGGMHHEGVGARAPERFGHRGPRRGSGSAS